MQWSVLMPWKIYARAMYLPEINDLEREFPRLVKSLRPGGEMDWLWKLIVRKENLLIAMIHADAGRPGVQAVASQVAEASEFTPPHLKHAKNNKLQSWRNRAKQGSGAIIATMLLCNGYVRDTYTYMPISTSKNPNPHQKTRCRQAEISEKKKPGQHKKIWGKGALFKKEMTPLIPDPLVIKVNEINQLDFESVP
jgi:hypothetical protein